MPILRSLNCSLESKENSYNPNILSMTIVSVLEILSPTSLTIQQQLHNQRKRYHPNPPYLSLPTSDYHLQQLRKQPNKAGGSFAPSVVIPFHLPRAPFANPTWGRTKGFGCLCSSLREICWTSGEIKSRFMTLQKGADSPGVCQLTEAEFPDRLLWIIAVRFCGTLYPYLMGHSLTQIK